jgi:hypothetical protein
MGVTPTPLSDKQHSKLLRSALKNTKRQRPGPRSQEGEIDADAEDAARALVDPWNHKAAKEEENSSSIAWFNGNGDATGEFSRRNPVSHQEKERMTTAQGDATVEIEMVPSSLATGQVYNSIPPTSRSNNLNLHRYPPSQVPRASTNSVGATVKQATKVIKTAVLHDARNISRKSEEDQLSLSWNVNSAHEAKVIYLFFFSPIFIHIFLTTLRAPASAWHVLFSLDSRTVAGHG